MMDIKEFVTSEIEELEKALEAEALVLKKKPSDKRWQRLVDHVDNGFVDLAKKQADVEVVLPAKPRTYMPRRSSDNDGPKSFREFILDNKHKIYQVLAFLGFLLVGQILINLIYTFTPMPTTYAMRYLMPLAGVLACIKIEYDILKEKTSISQGWILVFVFGGIYALLPLLAPTAVVGYIFLEMAKKRELKKGQVIFMTAYGYVVSLMLSVALILIETQFIMFPVNLGWEQIPLWVNIVCFLLSAGTVYAEGWIIISYFESDLFKGALGWVFGGLMCVAEIVCPLVGGYMFMLLERLVAVTFNFKLKKSTENEEIEE